MSISVDRKEGNSLVAKSIWDDVIRIRKQGPLVHNITNYVVMDITANVLLALGASPVMAHALEEAEDMCSIASSLVINIGTLSKPWVESMYRAFQLAKKKGIPVVFDPVGAGATPYRTEVARDFAHRECPAIIRGNASEISALSVSEKRSSTKGVDSTLSSESVLSDAQVLAQKTGSVVVISGETDFIVDEKNVMVIRNGHSLMPKIIGLGCSATAMIGAFSSVNASPFLSAGYAMAFIGIAGEIAAKKAQGPGSFKAIFIDTIYNMKLSDLESHLSIETL